MAKTERIQSMTQGRPAKLIFTFAIPLMLGNVCQLLYTVVDTAIVGQALGVNALAALGAATSKIAKETPWILVMLWVFAEAIFSVWRRSRREQKTLPMFTEKV